MLQQQKENGWALDTDIPWNTLQISAPLLPLDLLFQKVPGLTAEERLAISQFLGLMAVKAIAEHEHLLGVIQSQCTTRVAEAVDASEGMRPLMERFFEEEKKHSAAFSQYITEFTQKAGIAPSDLETVLPKFSANSLFTKFALLNNALGGNAIWHLIQITEHESIDLYRFLKETSVEIDPLYFTLNRLHYEEEIRHISFPPLVIRLAKPKSQKFNQKFARLLHAVWMVTQFVRLRHISSLKNKHFFFNSLHSAQKKVKLRQCFSFLLNTGLVILRGQRFSVRIAQ